MHRPKRIDTTDEQIIQSIIAELGHVYMSETDAATVGHNVVARIIEIQRGGVEIKRSIEQGLTQSPLMSPKDWLKQEAEKVSHITGFPEDDDIEAEEIQRQEQEFDEIVVFKGRRRIPGMPKDL